MKILTLCANCSELYRLSYSVRPYTLKSPTTELKDRCDHCKKPYKSQLKMYIVDKKGR